MKIEQYDLDGTTRTPPQFCHYCRKVVTGKAIYCCNACRQASYRMRTKSGEYVKPRANLNLGATYGICISCREAYALYENKLCGTCNYERLAHRGKTEQ